MLDTGTTCDPGLSVVLAVPPRQCVTLLEEEGGRTIFFVLCVEGVNSVSFRRREKYQMHVMVRSEWCIMWVRVLVLFGQC